MNYFNGRTPMRVRGILDLSKGKPQGQQAPAFPSFRLPERAASTPPPATTMPTQGGTKPTPTADLLGGQAVRGTLTGATVPNPTTQQAIPGAPAVRGTFGAGLPTSQPAYPIPTPTTGVRGVLGQTAAPANPPIVAAPMPATGTSFTPAPAPVPMTAGGNLVGPGNTPTPQTQTDPYAAQRAAAAGAAKSAAASSTAAGQVGQRQEQAQAGAVATASDKAAKTAGTQAPATTTQPAQPTPQDDLAEVRAYFQKLMTTQDDPVLRKQWNQLLISKGLENNAAMDALKMQINQDPALRGQPAGDTMLQELIRDSNFTLDQARGQLSIEAANRIRELNQLGVEGFQKLAQYRLERADAQRKELLSAGDYDGYAKTFKDQTGLDVDVSNLKSLSPATTQAVDSLSQAMVRNIEAGNMEGARRNFESIKALAPTLYGQLTFEDAVSGMDTYALQSEARQAVSAMVRTQVSQGDIRGALAGIEQLLPDRVARVTAGSKATQATDLTSINEALKAAGMSEVMDKAELIGREEDVWKALELAKLTSAAGKSVVDDTVSMLQGELQKMGFNPTDPEAARALRSYALNLQLTGGLKIGSDGKVQLDANSILPPWDPASVDSHLFTDWPVMGPDGKATSGWDPYGKDNPRPAADSALGRYYDDLDGKWEEYLLKTPKASRLTREQWFYATQAGTQEVDPAKVPGGIAGDTGEPDTDTLTIESVMQKVRTGKPLETKDFESLRASGQFETALANLPFGSNFPAWSKANPDRVAVIDGKVFRVDQGGSFKNGHGKEGIGTPERSDDYVTLTDMETGKVYYYSDATDVPEPERWFAEKPTSRSSKKVASPFGNPVAKEVAKTATNAATVGALIGAKGVLT